MNNKTEKSNQSFKLIEGYFKNTFSLSLFLMLALLSSTGCNGQVLQNKNEAPKSNSNIVVTSPSVLLDSTTDSTKTNQYRNGKKDGLWKTFYSNGQLKAEGNYKIGLKEGLHKEWSKNGILLSEAFYANGKGNGLTKWFHEKGHLAGEGQMKDDVRFGKWIICDIQENGFCIEAYFKDGKRDGIWKINHENAPDKLWKEQTFKDDKLISEKCWNEYGLEIECE
jgi:antitoxin component YwqK of YwqJK toxin-antitoxin module